VIILTLRTGIDRKTARRYISAAVELGLDRSGGEEQLADELIGQMVERLRPHWSDGHGEAWRAACPGRPDHQVGGRRSHRRQDRGTASSPQGGPVPNLGALRRRALWCRQAHDDGAGRRPYGCRELHPDDDQGILCRWSGRQDRHAWAVRSVQVPLTCAQPGCCG